MNGARRLVVLCVFCLSQSIAVAQGADTPPTDQARAEASAHFRRAVELFQEEAYRAALVEFQRAYDIAPDYRLLYNIGQTKLLLQDFLGAAQSYDGYLTGGGSSIPPERRAQVEEGLASMQQRVGRLGITVNRADADLFIDDLRVGKSPLANAVLVNVGRHRVSARTADGATEAKMVDVAGGDVAEVSLELSMPIALAAAGPAAPVSPWTPLRVAAVVGWSVGAAGLIGGAVTGALAGKANGDLDALLDTPSNNQTETSERKKQVADKRDSLKTLALLTDVLLPVGGAFAVAGTVLWFVDGKKDKPDEEQARATTKNSTRASLQWNVGPSSVSLRGRF